MKYYHPLKHIGINKAVPFLSEYHVKLFDCLVIACLQSYGITLIMYGFIEAYFWENDDLEKDQRCESSLDDWKDTKWMKLLAFLWCIVIARGIYKFLQGSRHDGFYELVKFFYHLCC